MVAVAVRERADEGQLVGVLGQQGERAAERQAGDRGLDLARDTGERRGGVEIRIKRLDVAGAAAEKQEDDRAIADVGLCRGSGGFFGGQQVRERKAAQARALRRGENRGGRGRCNSARCGSEA